VHFALGPPLRRVLERLGARGEPVPVDEFARRLLSITSPLDAGLARTLLGAALGCAPARLPDAIEPRRLPSLLGGPRCAVALDRADLVVVDLETTGLSAERCTILEIGAVRIRGLRAADRFQTLVDPGVPIPEAITALTGIDRQTLDGAPSPGQALRAFEAWTRAAPPAALVAHNASFDERFLRHARRREGMPPWRGPVLCTLRLARRFLPDLPRYDLDTLSAHFGISNRWRHRALGDAEATASALIGMLGASSARGLETVGDLLDLQSAPVKRGRS
jgi:DNA polymerase III subunit epsilon